MEGDEPSPGITCGDSGCRVTSYSGSPRGPGQSRTLTRGSPSHGTGTRGP